jgi:hypothetical protein
MNLFLGNNPIKTEKKKVSGRFTVIDGEKFYEISNYDEMQPFFISLASDSNHWMYISSTGGLTAGRRNSDTALFPYYTDDKITDSAGITGSETILHVFKNGAKFLWQPFSERTKGIYNIERSIAKSITGNKLIFKEENIDLGLTFGYAWMNSDRFGWVKKSFLVNNVTEEIQVYIADGLQNILPAGIDRLTQNTFSTLVDGYKKTERIDETTIGLYRMESILVDRAEPSESLRANVVWSVGIEQPVILLSQKQIEGIRNGETAKPEFESRGVRGAYFVCSGLVLTGGESKVWYLVAETAQDVTSIVNLSDFLTKTKNISELIERDITVGTESLIGIVNQADGWQETADEAGMARHFSNVLFNLMRGGIYNDGYNIDSAFFAQHIRCFNIQCYEDHKSFLNKLPEKLHYTELEGLIVNLNSAVLHRLFLEYLPLTFSRRHGDPSRPWNLFDINIKDEKGKKILAYQGNWRDIFQNWEALSMSFPGYINGIIAKFLNATTADGYNPYKVTNEGIEWEVIEPENPWSNIGYWGDHQIIYLLKLLELSDKYYPRQLQNWFNKDIFAFANVPYRVKTYNEIISDPKNSIRFEEKLHQQIGDLIPQFGGDAKLVMSAEHQVITVSFTEKILVTLLTKLSNFIPEAGIWMNTLRPEWNDANNALVGTGASMVTLYYMRRFVKFVSGLYARSELTDFVVSVELLDFYQNISEAFMNYKHYALTGFDDKKRREVTDVLGKSGEIYRTKIYAGFSGNKKAFSKSSLLSFLDTALLFIDQSIECNKRPDKLYHAYNLVSFGDGTVTVRHLYEMLEGQVAVLSSGKLGAEEVLGLFDSLRMSALYRADQNSYTLYPDKKLPELLSKNNIAENDLKAIPLLMSLVEAGNSSIVSVDKKGGIHFNASFNNVSFLRKALHKLRLRGEYSVSAEDVTAIEILYEKIFDHQSFTGRSGTFYKYEGLGCIYWHMVSKLLLAIAENIQTSLNSGANPAIVEALKKHYREVKSGIGAYKSPVEYGSFPFDPYSHTPSMAGVQQPGMTGQVKEDIISRFLELGVIVEGGAIRFSPDMLQFTEFIGDENDIKYLKFNYSGTLVIYRIGKNDEIEIRKTNGDVNCIQGLNLSAEISSSVFSRDGSIESLTVTFTKPDV